MNVLIVAHGSSVSLSAMDACLAQSHRIRDLRPTWNVHVTCYRRGNIASALESMPTPCVVVPFLFAEAFFYTRIREVLGLEGNMWKEGRYFTQALDSLPQLPAAIHARVEAFGLPATLLAHGSTKTARSQQSAIELCRLLNELDVDVVPSFIEVAPFLRDRLKERKVAVVPLLAGRGPHFEQDVKVPALCAKAHLFEPVGEWPELAMMVVSRIEAAIAGLVEA